MTIYGYTFDGDYYADTEADKQRLLEDVSTALDTEVWSDPDMKDATDDERSEAVSMSFDGTHYQADFWSNCIAIMQHAPYTLDIRRIDDDSKPNEISDICEALQLTNPIDVAYAAEHGLVEVDSNYWPVVLADSKGNEFYGGDLHDAVMAHKEWVSEGKPND